MKFDIEKIISFVKEKYEDLNLNWPGIWEEWKPVIPTIIVIIFIIAFLVFVYNAGDRGGKEINENKYDHINTLSSLYCKEEMPILFKEAMKDGMITNDENEILEHKCRTSSRDRLKKELMREYE